MYVCVFRQHTDLNAKLGYLAFNWITFVFPQLSLDHITFIKRTQRDQSGSPKVETQLSSFAKIRGYVISQILR